jgi:hypothetical protein
MRKQFSALILILSSLPSLAFPAKTPVEAEVTYQVIVNGKPRTDGSAINL